MTDQKVAAYNIADLRGIACRKTAPELFKFLDRGTDDNVFLRSYRAEFDHVRFILRTSFPRVWFTKIERYTVITSARCCVPVPVSA